MDHSEELKDFTFIKLYSFTFSLPKEQGYMLSYLLNADSYIDARLTSDPDYFMCDKKGFLSNILCGWSIKEISHAINGLIEAGYIYHIVDKIGYVSHSFIKINYDKVNELATNYLEQDKKGNAKRDLPGVPKGISRECQKGLYIIYK